MEETRAYPHPTYRSVPVVCTWFPGPPTACCSQLLQAWGSEAQDSASEGDMAISGPGSLPTVAGTCQREGTGEDAAQREPPPAFFLSPHLNRSWGGRGLYTCPLPELLSLYL